MEIRTRLLAFLVSLVLAFGIVGGSFAQEDFPLPEAAAGEEQLVSDTPEPTEAPTPEPAQQVPADPEPEPAQPPAAQEPSTPESEGEPVEEDVQEPTPEPSDVPTEEPAAESDPVLFAQGLVKLERGTILFTDQELTAPGGTLLADGVAYAQADQENQRAQITYTLDGQTLLEAFASLLDIEPLGEAEISAYIAQPGELFFEGYPLFALALELPGEETAPEEPQETEEPVFLEGLVTLPSGVAVYEDDALEQAVGTLLAEGVVYQLPAPEAGTDEDGTPIQEQTGPIAIVYTADGKGTEIGYLTLAAAPLPLQEEVLAEYLGRESGVAYRDCPLFPLDLELALSYEMRTYGFPGMPGDYVLSAEELAAKAALTENGVLEQTRNGTPGKDYVEDEVLLLAETQEFAQMVAESYAAALGSYSDGLAVIKLSGFTVLEVITAAADLQARLIAVEPNFLQYLEPNHANGGKKADASAMMAFAAAPTQKTWADYKNMDPFLQNPSSSAHYNTGAVPASGYQYMHDMVDTYSAWGLTTGSSGVKVGILDSGFYASHTDLSGKITGITNWEGSSSLSDSVGHGTHVAGIIAAKQNNHSGGCGIAPGVSLLGYKVANSSGGIPSSAIYYGLRAMRDNGAWLVNMSLGGPAYSSTEKAAVDYCLTAGIPVIAATGNDGGGTNSYPANYPGVISVGAVDPGRQRAPYSNYGSNVTLAAPGSYILSASITSSTVYESWNGTSMATPVVSGVAALYYSARGTRDLNGDGQTNMADVTYLRDVLTKNCVKISGGMGAGIVNAGNLFKKIVTKPTISLTLGVAPYTNLTAVPSNAVVHLTPGFNGAYMVYTTDGTTPSVKNGVVVGKETNGDPAFTLAGFPAGKCTVKAMAVNAQGLNSGVVTYTFTIDNKLQLPSRVDIAGSRFLYPGKSATYTATLTPVSTLKVDWSVISGDATIGAATGKLTLGKAATGTVKIRAAVKGFPAVYADHTLNVTTSLVSKITPSLEKISLAVGGVPKAMTVDINFKDGSLSSGKTQMSYSATSSNAKVFTVQDTATGWNIIPVAKGSGTLKITALDGSGVSKSVSVSVLQLATELNIEGGATSCIAAGLKRTLKAVIAPATVSSKAVQWTLVSAPYGVTLSKTGALSVPAGVGSGTIQVRCDALDGSGKTATQVLTVFPSKVTSITLTSTDPKAIKNAGTVKGGTLYTVDVANSVYGSTHNETQLKLGYVSAGPSTAAPVVWASSNLKVATVSQTGLVQALSVGSATITCTAMDGSGKKASVSLKVITPNSNIDVFPSTVAVARGNPLIGYGKTSKVNVTYASTYGTPSVKSVNWDFTVTGPGVGDITSYCKAYSLVKLSSSGVLSVKKHPSYSQYFVTVTATTTDGTNLKGSVTYIAQPLTTTLAIYDTKAVTLSAYSNYYYDFWFYTDNAYADDFTITSSNPLVAAPFDAYGGQVLYEYIGHFTKSGKTYYVMEVNVMGYKPGSATITVKTNDGSNKSVSFKVTVK